ncbi:MAG: AMP-binding protein, partial [Clostridia bacterium]|nr:AMP-binding protein [Clostridia bacterium]
LYLSLREMIYSSAETFGEKTYLRFFRPDKEIGELSFYGFSLLVEDLGSYFYLPENGCERIAILSENRFEWVVAYAAAVAAGKTVIPLDKDLSFDQAVAFMHLAEADTLIYSSLFAQKVAKIPEDAGIKKFICLDGMEAEGGPRFTTLRRCISAGDIASATGKVNFRRIRTDSSRVCAIIFTSGTTGTSKGVMLTEDNILACIHAASNMVNIDEKDTIFSVLPYHHTYELCCGILTPICLGTTVCINNSLKYFTKNIQLFRPTAMVLVPMFVSSLAFKIEAGIEKSRLSAVIKGGTAVSNTVRKVGIDMRRVLFSKIHSSLGGRLKTIICGGAALDPQLVKRFEEIGIAIAQGYGITECAPLVAVTPWKKVKYDSVGLPIPGSTVKIMGEDRNGEEYDMPVGEIGEICVKGPHVMKGYYKNPEATAEAFNMEGFFKTGDYGRLDEDGYLYITGRKKNIIILDNGKNVYPEEIEEYLYRLDIIKECVVCERQVGSDKMLTAVIFPDYEKFEGCTESEIKERFKKEIANVNRELPSFKQIHHIEIKKTEFEKTSTKKILRYKV